MRSGKVFLTWILFASAAACLRPLERRGLELEPRDALLNKRQRVSTTTDATTSSATDTATPTTTTKDVKSTSEAAPTTSDVSATEAATTSTPTSTSTSTSTPTPESSQVPSSPASVAAQTTASVSLLFTESASVSTSETPAMITATPTPVSDTNVPFVDSKYHQMIIALASLCGALIIAMIALAVVALRARSDVDLLHDRLSRYEEGFDLPPRKGEAGAGYGRISLNDPDEMKSVRSRKTTGESGTSSLPLKNERRLSGTPMGSGTPPGNRRVAFGSEGSSPNGTENAPSLPPLLNNASKSDASLFQRLPGDRTSTSSLGLSGQGPPPIQVAFPTSQQGGPPNKVLRQSSGPRPNPGSRRVSLVDKGVVVPLGSPRRLPSAPGSLSSLDTRSDPYIGGSPPN